MAYEDKAKNCDLNLVRDFFKDVGEVESARILRVETPAPVGKPRPTRPDLERAKFDTPIEDAVTELLADPAGKYVVATTAAGHYWVVTPGEKLTAKKVESAPAVGGGLVGGDLWVSRTKPDRFERIDVPTGKVLSTHALDTHAPRTFFAAPAHGRVFFPRDGILHGRIGSPA